MAHFPLFSRNDKPSTSQDCESRYLEQPCGGYIAENDKKVFPLLPEDDIATVDRFETRMPTRTLSLPSFDSAENAEDAYEQLVKLYIFAKGNNNRLLQDHVHRQLLLFRQKGTAPPQVEFVQVIYDYSHLGSSIRRLLSGWYAWDPDRDWLSQDANFRNFISETPEFALDFEIAYAKRPNRSCLDPDADEDRKRYLLEDGQLWISVSAYPSSGLM